MGWRRWVHPLAVILLAQALVSGRLIWANSAFVDEANYLWQGRLEWQHWLHGTPVPAFTDTGAPQLYPALAALAADLGGLTLVRLMSLVFMLGFTVLVFLTARRLSGRPAALWAAALTGFSEPVLRLAFVTYDPLGCVLFGACVYLVVRAAAARRGGELAAVAGVCLVLACVVSASLALYIPVMVLVMLCAWADQRGWQSALVAVVWQLVLIGGLAVVALSQLHVWPDFVAWTGGFGSGPGFGSGSVSGVAAVFGAAWGWAGLLECAAVAGAVLAFVSNGWRHPRSWLMVVLVLAGLVAPAYAYQAHLGTGASSPYPLDAWMVPGVGLSALAVGYLASRISVAVVGSGGVNGPGGVVGPGRAVGSSGAVGSRRAAAGVATVLLLFPLTDGALAADSAYRYWPNTSALVAALRQRGLGGFGAAGGSVIVETQGTDSFYPVLFSYYLPGGSWLASSPATRQGVLTGRYPAAVEDLTSAYLSRAVVPGRVLTPDLSRVLLSTAKGYPLGAALEASKRYEVAAVLPYTTSSQADPGGVFVIWKRARLLVVLLKFAHIRCRKRVKYPLLSFDIEICATRGRRRVAIQT